MAPSGFIFILMRYNEPPYIHVATPEGECKFWLDPVKLARNQNLSPKVIRQIEKLVFENSLFLYAKHNEFHVR
ncbi:MAG: DUF4160 domain-containing protein [Methylococcaceae bacterium]